MVAKRLSASVIVFMLSAASADEAVRDPFATLSDAPTPPEAAPLLQSPSHDFELKLKAILWSDRPLANIGGMIVAPGDRVHDYTVKRLSRQSALLHSADKTILLVLEKDS